MDNKALCLSLIQCESEEEIETILREKNFWDDSSAWKFFGDNENNYSTIGNQQSKPEAALVEKLVNSVDAVLMGKCIGKGISPESSEAPNTIYEALERFYGIRDGRLSNISAKERTILSQQNIGLVATGERSNPCYIVWDRGEGQLPENMPNTLLSLAKSNKLRIPFVQGKFNMGGTGVFEFCGKSNISLILTKRDPAIQKSEWGFTLIRRENPSKGTRNSVYKYLAPNDSILSFDCLSLPILPSNYPIAYEEPLEWGTYIKLYEYQMTGLKGPIYQDLFYRTSLLLPGVALPIRFYERRKNYQAQTYEKTLTGLSTWLDDEKNQSIEPNFPSSHSVVIKEQRINISIYVFTAARLKESYRYKRTDGILFTVNGQTHAIESRRFFASKKVGLGYLADSILVTVDCSNLNNRSKEQLFMNSRDRLRSCEIKSQIEDELNEILRDHPGLRELQNKRRQEEIENKLGDSKPLIDVIEKILKGSPALSKLFIQGKKIANPFSATHFKKIGFKGEKFPHYFKLYKEYEKNNSKKCPINTRFKIQFRTDAENDYFERAEDPGKFSLYINNQEVADYSISLWNGHANLTIQLPEQSSVGEIIEYHSKVSDISQVSPFASAFFVQTVAPVEKVDHKNNSNKKRQSNGNKTGSGNLGQFLALPEIREVRKDEWDKYEFDKESALKVISNGGNYDFFINMDNIYLVHEKKNNQQTDLRLLDARFQYGLVLIGLALLKQYDGLPEGEEAGDDVYSAINNMSRAVSPILLPMISSLGNLQAQDVVYS